MVKNCHFLAVGESGNSQREREMYTCRQSLVKGNESISGTVEEIKNVTVVFRKVPERNNPSNLNNITLFC